MELRQRRRRRQRPEHLEEGRAQVQSPALYAAPPKSSAKSQRRKRRRKPAGDLKSNKPRFVRARTTTSARQTAKNKTDITCDSLLLRPDVGRSSRSGERWWQDGAARART